MENEKRRQKIFTIPNILSFFRIALIPLFTYTYLVKESTLLTVLIIIISGISDVVDGYIARHFNMGSDLGKALDPLADKLTQATLLYCLLTRFPNIIYVFIILIIKEIVLSILSFIAIKKTHHVTGADWHGKMTTVLLYAMMFMHIVWADIPLSISNLMILICLASMLLSFVLYAIKHIKAFVKK